MRKRIIGACLLAAALCAGPVLAQPRANTSQKGSLLIYPLIDVDPADTTNTLIEISNDNIIAVHVECFYVNETKGRSRFDFDLTPKQTASWQVLTGTGDINAGLFPSTGTFPGNNRKGELICFAVDAGSQNQISFNHLTGTATVVHLADGDATQKKQAFRYNAWAFMARAVAEGSPVGAPGTLQLTGTPGAYDACPLYNIANFMPNGATLPGSGVTTIDNDLSVVSCNQDLKQDFKLHTTKLLFGIWNAHENSSSAFVCVDSVATVTFGPGDRSPGLVNGSNFDFTTLGTPNARYQVQGIASNQCPAVFGTPESAGLLGVATASVALGGDPGESQEIASTTHAAGMVPGFILWDFNGPPAPSKTH